MVRGKRPTWFAVVAGVLILWGLMGVFACIQQIRLGAEAMGPATEYDRALFASLPTWYNGVYALATGAGLAGAVALFLGRRVALPLFVIGLVAVLVQFGYLFATSDIIDAKGVGTIYFPIFIIAVTAGETWLANHAARRGWLR
jgi:hypothetical protein